MTDVSRLIRDVSLTTMTAHRDMRISILNDLFNRRIICKSTLDDEITKINANFADSVKNVVLGGIVE